MNWYQMYEYMSASTDIKCMNYNIVLKNAIVGSITWS